MYKIALDCSVTLSIFEGLLETLKNVSIVPIVIYLLFKIMVKKSPNLHIAVRKSFVDIAI